MKSQQQRTGRQYNEAEGEWQDSHVSFELPLTELVAPLLRSGTPDAVGEI